MTLHEIKQISIKEYLQNAGISPVRNNNHYGMYHSPFREDNNASMKVDYNQNLWIDYGTGEGGSIIDLVAKVENCSINEAIKKLENNSFSFHRNNDFDIANYTTKQEQSIQIMAVKKLSNPALLDYMNKRCVNIEIAKHHCKEIHYSVYGKPYFAIGFQNNSGGWVLRSEPFKGCTSMDVKTFFNAENKSDTKESCFVFEGFMDFLSYLTMKKEKEPKQDTVVLNSTVNLPKVKSMLSAYQKIYAFLDNDEGGKLAVKNLRSFCKEVHDQSAHYTNYNDLNDYLCSRSVPKQTVKKKPNRRLKM